LISVSPRRGAGRLVARSVGHEDRCAAVGQLVAEELAFQEGIERNEDRPDLGGGEEQVDDLLPVGEEDGHPVAGPDAGGGQPGRYPVGTAVHVGQGEELAAAAYKGRVGRGGHPAAERADDGLVAVHGAIPPGQA
jgi:hypothetical protein